MTVETRYLVYPDGDMQETDRLLRIDELVDLNGFPLEVPLADPRTIAYRPVKIVRKEEKGETTILQYLELVPVRELGSL